jgi:hypothetical protein
MFDLRTESQSQLKRIVVAGTGGIILGMVLIAFNLVIPLVAATGYDLTNLAFGVFGIVVVVLATHPTYQAAERLDSS